jgi:uroporphyrinogen-III synthase
MISMNILIAQPEPKDQNSPYYELAEKYSLNISFVPFIFVESLEKSEFREQKIKILDHTAIILTSRNSVDHFFRICEILNISLPEDMKYFCLSEHVAYYLQKYIVPKRRKIFTGKKNWNDLTDKFKKHNKENFLIVSSQNPKNDIKYFLDKHGINYTEGTFFKVSSNDLSGLSINDFKILAFFSPADVKSLFENFPDYKQSDTIISCYGSRTYDAAKDRGLEVNIEAPVPGALSMTDALSLYLKSAIR